MKLCSRFSTSEFHSSLFLLIFLLNLKLGYLQPDAIECDWSVQRLSCPPYATTDWECLQAQLNCTNDKEYHCLRDESGEWTEICAKPITCSKGKEPVLKNSQIVCSNCKHPERYEPVDGTESYKYSECRRIKTSCRRDVSYECAVDKAVRHAQNRQCRCDNEKDYMPQNYDLNSDTWICKDPNDLNCIHAPCPEDVYGNAQTRGSDYRCFVDPNRPSTSDPSQRPSDRSSTVAVTENHATRSSHNGDTEADPVTSPKLVNILLIVSLVALLGLSIAIVVCKLMKRYLWCRKNKYAMPEGPLEVTEIQYRQMSLSWKPPNILPSETHREPLVIHYVIEQVQGNTRDWVEVTKTKETSCQVIDLDPGTFYNFRVSAEYVFGISSPLTTQKMYQTKCLRAPEMPQSLTICKTTATYITLSWEPPAEDGGTPITGYVVRYCNISDNNWIKGQVLEDHITVWKQEDLIKGEEYMFQVTANNKMGESDPLESAKPVRLLREPSKPEDVTVAGIKCNEVTLSWNAPKDNGGTGILYYHIQLKQEGSMWENRITIRSGVLTKTIKNLKPEHSYYFGICAENTVGEGEYCETTEPTQLPKRLGPPDSPLGPLESFNIDYNELILSWKPPTYDGGFPVTQYKVEARESWGLYTPETIVSAGTTMYHVKNLNDGTKYRFRVYAINEKGPSEKALVSEDIVTKTNYPPDVPEPLEVLDVSDTKIILAWKLPKNNEGSPVTQFTIEMKEDSLLTKLSNWQNITLSAETTHYEFTELKEGTTYKFRVRAENIKGNSYSVEVSCTTLIVTGPPGAPEGTLEAADITEDALTLVWKKPLDDGGLPIERYRIAKKDTVGWTEVFNNNPEETRYRWVKLSKGTKHLFRVEAINKKGPGPSITKEVSTRTPKERSFRRSVSNNKNAGDPSSDTQRKSQTSDSHEDASLNSRISERKDNVSAEAPQAPAAQTLHKPAPPPPKGPISYSNVMENSVTLSWHPPDSIAKSQVQGYTIAYKDLSGEDWTVGGFESQLTFTQGNLLSDHEYIFSITAKHAKGTSEPLISEEPVNLKRLLRKPSTPAGPLKLVVIDSKSVKLSWQLPSSHESCLVEEFKVEYREFSESDWFQALAVGNTDNDVTWTVPKEGTQYEFQVTAVSSYGVESDPLQSKEPVKIPASKKAIKLLRGSIGKT